MNTQPPVPSLGLRTRLLWLLWLPLLVGLDQVTKVYAVAELEPIQHEGPISLLNDMLRLHYAANPGAFGSLGSELTETQRFWVLIIPNLVLLPGVLLWMLFHKHVTRPQYAALGLILAGGIGNMVDRLRLGYVVDFLNVGINLGFYEPRTHIFNVADMYITFAVVLLMWMVLKSSPQSSTEVAPASGTK